MSEEEEVDEEELVQRLALLLNAPTPQHHLPTPEPLSQATVSPVISRAVT